MIVLLYEPGSVDADHCCLLSSGRGWPGWRPGPGGEEMEQENPADAAWSPGTEILLPSSNYFENRFQVD